MATTRRSKAEIEAEKKAKLERKLERERKRVEKEAKAKAREEKKAAKEAKLKAKEDAAKAKELQKLEDEKIQKIIDKLKVGKEYAQPKPMTIKEKDLCKKILEVSVTSICSQTYGQHSFNILSHRGNEFVISVDNIYYFYNKAKNAGINFGSVFETWLETCKRIPWTESEPPIQTEDVNLTTTKKKRGKK
jgi:Fe2+ transport system protein B